MGINKYNSSGCYDPTAYMAMTNVRQQQKSSEQYKKKYYRSVVYICSPFAGDVLHNTGKACNYARFVKSKHAIPYAPHLLFPQFLDDNNPADRAEALEMGIDMLRRCDEIWVFGESISVGMAGEIQAAEKFKKPIRYFTDHCEEVKKDA